jgi:hypothetical protein
MYTVENHPGFVPVYKEMGMLRARPLQDIATQKICLKEQFNQIEAFYHPTFHPSFEIFFSAETFFGADL